MDEINLLLQDLADDVSEYERQGGLVLFRRQGNDFDLRARDVPGSGPVVSGRCGQTELSELPIRRFVQQEILQLNRLAGQICRTVERAQKTRPAPYIDGPAELEHDGHSKLLTNTVVDFQRFINEQESGTTRLIQLMADAGQGKTVLLEQLAHATASAYVPDAYPQPLLLTVDLLGRYVGTIDDAIAGALNNTYRFPGLTQRDVALCVRQRWIVLALDGFDELVARVGVRDAFLRVTELLDQLDNAGTVILSARRAFFEVYQITSAIRSYLQPRQGSYATAIVRLRPWEKDQGRQIFRSLGSANPESDLEGLLEAFGGDETLVLQPFFLTRLALLWTRGQRFAEASKQRDKLRRTAYTIRELIEREASTKWTDPGKQTPLLSEEQHSLLLQGIAEEMWRTGAFKLTLEELRIAAQITLAPMRLPSAVAEAAEARVATHAAFMVWERGYAFLHDTFLYYYLGLRLASLITSKAAAALRPLLETSVLLPEVCEWTDWVLRDKNGKRSEGVTTLLGIRTIAKGNGIVDTNIGNLVARLLDDPLDDTKCEVEGLTFEGGAFRGRRYVDVTFISCAWWQADLVDTEFEKCRFVRCELGDVAIGGTSKFTNTEFLECDFKGLDVDGKRTLFDPPSIQTALASRGATITSQPASEQKEMRRVKDEIVAGLSKLVRQATKSCDFAEEEVEKFLPDAKRLLRIGVESGVLRTWAKTTSGPHRDFLRFAVDRQVFLRGQAERTGDQHIDDFWEKVEARWPAR